MSVPPRQSSPQLFAFNFFQTPSSTREALQAEAYFWPEIRPRKWDIFYVDFSSFCIAVVRAIRTGHHLQFHFLCVLATCCERQLAQISKNLPSTFQVYLVVVEALAECPKQHRKKWAILLLLLLLPILGHDCSVIGCIYQPKTVERNGTGTLGYFPKIIILHKV